MPDVVDDPAWLIATSGLCSNLNVVMKERDVGASEMEGDTTAFYINKRLQNIEVEVTTLARGVAVGDELQYADELTLIRSLQQRLPYSATSNSSAT